LRFHCTAHRQTHIHTHTHRERERERERERLRVVSRETSFTVKSGVLLSALTAISALRQVVARSTVLTLTSSTRPAVYTTTTTLQK